MSSHSYTSDAAETLLADLNEAQRQAVTHAGDALLLVAGAGTGKTRVLTRRVAWLITQGMAPHAILTITFTNKAASELRSRLERLPGGAGVWAGTFHGFGAFLLRRHGERIGIEPRFTILDRDDQRSLLKGVYKDLGLDPQHLAPADVAAMISHVKNGGGGRAPLDLWMADVQEMFDAVHKAYVERCRAAGLVDFDDLLVESVRLLQTCEDLADLYRQRFGHVLVDEYQDTNIVQRNLLLQLVGPSSRITVVGDPDQSIYRWRGAEVRNILDFAEDFPGAAQVLLERNYRSTGHILGAAEAVIARNLHRHEKRLHTERERGMRVQIVRCRDADDEGHMVARQVVRWHGAGHRLDEIAVFYRVNSLSRAIELALNQSGIPYVVVAGLEFFQRREVKDLLAYARLVLNPRDEAAFLRVVNLPRRGVGAGSLQKLRGFAAREGLPLGEAARRAAEAGVSKRALKGITTFLALLDRVRAMPLSPVAPLLEALLEDSGYRAKLLASEDAFEQGRQENVEELVAFAREFDKKEPEGDLLRFLERTALVSDQDGYDRDSGRVNLMSVHAAKGLEFPCVLIAGAEKGLFPHSRNADDPAAAEEERRLFYVAMTRAQDELTILHAAHRQTYTGPDYRSPSPYLSDIPGEHLDTSDHAAWGSGAEVRFGDAPDSHDDTVIVRETSRGLEPGARVVHPYFGPGRIEALHGAGEDARVTIEFDSHGRKQLLLRHARLEALP